MARLPRITTAGVPVHLVQRGNNRQAPTVIVFKGWLSIDYQQALVRVDS